MRSMLFHEVFGLGYEHVMITYLDIWISTYKEIIITDYFYQGHSIINRE